MTEYRKQRRGRKNSLKLTFLFQGQSYLTGVLNLIYMLILVFIIRRNLKLAKKGPKISSDLEIHEENEEEQTLIFSKTELQQSPCD